METGFGAVLERFEAAFGKTVTTVILALIGIATALFCCSVIWDLALGPAVRWITSAQVDLSIPRAIQGVWYVVSAGFGFGVVQLMVTLLERKKLREEISLLTEERDELRANLADIDRALTEAGV